MDNSILESIKHIDKAEKEYWEARELMPSLGYTKWQKFKEVINKAMLACESSNHPSWL